MGIQNRCSGPLQYLKDDHVKMEHTHSILSQEVFSKPTEGKLQESKFGPDKKIETAFQYWELSISEIGSTQSKEFSFIANIEVQARGPSVRVTVGGRWTGEPLRVPLNMSVIFMTVGKIFFLVELKDLFNACLRLMLLGILVCKALHSEVHSHIWGTMSSS